MNRVVHQTDGVAWLKANPLTHGQSIITSLPDSSEVPALGLAGWRQWFIETGLAASDCAAFNITRLRSAAAGCSAPS